MWNLESGERGRRLIKRSRLVRNLLKYWESSIKQIYNWKLLFYFKKVFFHLFDHYINEVASVRERLTNNGLINFDQFYFMQKKNCRVVWRFCFQRQATGPWGFFLLTTIKKSDGIFRLRDDSFLLNFEKSNFFLPIKDPSNASIQPGAFRISTWKRRCRRFFKYIFPPALAAGLREEHLIYLSTVIKNNNFQWILDVNY